MTEKRFEVSSDEKIIVDIWGVNKNTTEYDIHKSCDLINSLYEENERLRKELSECEKFRYSGFKRVEKPIKDKDNCVLNKDAKSPPCKAYDECLKRQGTNEPLPCIVNWMMGRTFENMLLRE